MDINGSMICSICGIFIRLTENITTNQSYSRKRRPDVIRQLICFTILTMNAKLDKRKQIYEIIVLLVKVKRNVLGITRSSFCLMKVMAILWDFDMIIRKHHNKSNEIRRKQCYGICYICFKRK